jgi:hypothetical protein
MILIILNFDDFMLADDSDEESAVVRKEKKLTKGKLFQKTNSKAHDKSSGTWQLIKSD